MEKQNLDKVLENIKQQKYKDNNIIISTLDSKIKEIIYHDIVKLMVEGKNEYSLLKYGIQSLFDNKKDIQIQIKDWLYNEHKIECIKKYIDINDPTNNLFYYVAVW